MQEKFNMTREENIFTAKRNIVDYIWKSAKLERLAVTYPDTEAIYNGMSVSGVKVSEIVAVNNLKHAWQFLFDNLDYPIDFPYICKLKPACRRRYAAGVTDKRAAYGNQCAGKPHRHGHHAYALFNEKADVPCRE